MVDIEIRETLVELAKRYETAEFIVGDPSWWMHQVDGGRNQEATAFVASAISYGSRSQFMPRIGLLVEWAGGDVDQWLRSGAYKERFALGDKRCFYRLYNSDTMRRFFDAYSQMLTTYGSMKEYLDGTGCERNGILAVERICRWFAEHDGGGVVPKDAMSACKRVCMFLRWMVRDGSPVDLGLWTSLIDKRTLVMPLDTHVVSEAIKLGLLKSRCASMSAAIRLSDAMREVFPDDPLRGDFALFGYGVSASE